MKDQYSRYPQTHQDRTFIGDWLMNRPLDNECVVDVATRAREGDEGAVIALLRIEGHSRAETSPDGITRTIDCLSTSCDGCVRLLQHMAGVEAVNCAVQAAQAAQAEQH